MTLLKTPLNLFVLPKKNPKKKKNLKEKAKKKTKKEKTLNRKLSHLLKIQKGRRMKVLVAEVAAEVVVAEVAVVEDHPLMEVNVVDLVMVADLVEHAEDAMKKVIL